MHDDVKPQEKFRAETLSKEPSADRGAVGNAFDHWEIALNKLGKVQTALTERLGPVLQPEAPEVADAPMREALTAARPPMSPLAHDMDGLAIRLDGHVLEIQQLIDRLDLPA